MKYCVLLMVPAIAVAQQSTSGSYIYDLHGRRVEGSRISSTRTPGSSERRETVQTVNGRQVPLESTEEKVLSDSGGVRIIERLHKRYDQNGQVASTEKVRMEERKNPDGSVNSSATTMRSNINGGFDLHERRTTTSTKSGDTTTSSTAVERGLNGSLEPSERIEEVRREAKDGTGSVQALIQRKDTNGRFVEWQKESTEKTLQNGVLVENSAIYGSMEHAGLQLVRQTVARTTKQASGAESKEVEVFELYQPGRPKSSGRPVLSEVQTIERTPSGGGATETVSVRRPMASDPSRLGPARIIGQTICTGECK